MTEQNTAPRGDELARRAAEARAQSRQLRAEAVKLALQVADIEDAAAEILARLAAQNPGHASRLQAMSQAAARHATHERERATALPA
jgi:hypothetical protein